MFVSVLIAAIIGAHMAQPTERPAEERKTYIITPENGKQFVGFWNERRPKGMGIYEVEVDTPWEPGRFFQTVNESKVSYTPESPWNRAERRKKGAQEAGYVEINGRYYLSSEVELADRSRAMAAEVEARNAARTLEFKVNTEPQASPEAVTEVEPPGFFVQWGPQAGLALVAISLIGLVARTMLFPRRQLKR